MTAPHLILYDGVCGVCNSLCQFVLKRDKAGLYKFASLQSDLGREMVTSFGGNPDELNTFYVVTNFETPERALLSKATAAFYVMATLGGIWKMLSVARVLPNFILNFGYDLFAKYRYRVFGRYDVCPVPSPEQRARFLS